MSVVDVTEDDPEPQKFVTIIGACMDRNQNLGQVVESWFDCVGISQIVLIDWSSCAPVLDGLFELIQKTTRRNIKLTIVRIHDQKKWVLSLAYNLAARMADRKTTHFLKMDSDYKISSDFLQCHPMNSHEFYTGNWKNAKTPNEKHLNGFIYVTKKDFFRVNGYNEYIQSYGWDDTDLYERLKTTNRMIQKDIRFDKICHLEHSDVLRLQHSLNENVSTSFKSIQYNRILSTHLKWNKSNVMSRFRLTPSFLTIHDHFDLNLDLWEGRLEHCYSVVPTLVQQTVKTEFEQFLTAYSKSTTTSLSIPTKMGMSAHQCRPNCYAEFNIIEFTPMNGLGNRLRALASALNLVTCLNQRPKFNKFVWKCFCRWVPDIHCGAEFADLFQVPKNNNLFDHFVLVQDFARNSCPLRKRLVMSDANGELSGSKGVTMTENLNLFFQDFNYDCPITLEIASACVVASPFQNWTSECQYVRQLISSDAVLNQIKQVHERLTEMSLSLHQFIGVHVRLGQPNVVADDISSWHPDKKSQWVHWRQASSTERFEKQMKQMLDQNVDVRGFYLAGDCPEVYTHLLKSFENHIKKPVFLFTDRKTWDRSSDQLVSALADVILLSKTKKFLASNWSSFSELVRRFANIETLIAGVHF
jgi:hypothetical protein